RLEDSMKAFCAAPSKTT
ncbi:hypothetical protein ACNVD4_19425, partial [Rhizobium sp. BR5]